MPKFYIHTDDGEFLHHDETGHDLPDKAAARVAAIDALPDMARDKLPDGDHRKFEVEVEDESGRIIFTASLELTGMWNIEHP